LLPVIRVVFRSRKDMMGIEGCMQFAGRYEVAQEMKQTMHAQLSIDRS
jgi:hypothetical protein